MPRHIPTVITPLRVGRTMVRASNPENLSQVPCLPAPELYDCTASVWPNEPSPIVDDNCESAVAYDTESLTMLTSPSQLPMPDDAHRPSPIQVITMPRQAKCPEQSNSKPHNISAVRPAPTQSTKMFHMCLLNVRSLGDDNKAGRIRDFVVHENLDGAVFTETWTKSDDTSAHQIGDITPTGFSFYHHPRCGRRGGGVGLLLKSNMKVKNLPHSSYQSFEHMQVSITASKAHINLLIIYRPPPSTKNKLTADQFFREFGTLLEEVTISPGKLLIMGDFNFHLDDVNNTQARKLCNMLELFNLTQHVREGTHNSGHILDLVITRSSDSIVNRIYNFNPLLSDHEAIMFDLSIEKPPQVTKSITYRCLRKIDFTKFLDDINLSALLNNPATEVGDLCDTYYTELSSILDRHAPLKTRDIVDRVNSEWFTDELGAMKRDLRKLERKHKHMKLTIDKEIYNIKSQEYNRLQGETKERYYTNKVYDCLKDQGSMFVIINKLLHRSSSSPLPMYDDPTKLANSFADFFESKVLKIHAFLSDDNQSRQDQCIIPEPEAKVLLES